MYYIAPAGKKVLVVLETFPSCIAQLLCKYVKMVDSSDDKTSDLFVVGLKFLLSIIFLH